MQFIDLNAQQKRIKDLIDRRIQNVLSHGQYINGPEVEELESSLSSYTGTKHAVGCGSGTDALLMALMAYGIGPGDAILTTPFTFVATAEVISLLGATPVFVDVDPRTFNMDPAKLEQTIQALESSDKSIAPLPRSVVAGRGLTPRGVIAVDLFGLPADYDRINAIAKSHGLFVIEDAAQSFGATYRGKRSCSLADMGCTSFFPAKPLGCYGDGGMCFTNDDGLAEVLRSIRVHGMGSDKYENVRIGINGRLDTFQAAILLAKHSIFPEEVELRQQAADRYNDALRQGMAGSRALTLQHIPSEATSVWAQYSILAGSSRKRTEIQDSLKQAGIPTAIYYPKPLHLQKAFEPLGYREGDFPVTEELAQSIFSIPMHPYLNAEDQKRITDVICAG